MHDPCSRVQVALFRWAAIGRIAFDAGVSNENANAGLRYDDPLAFCLVLPTENELRLAVSDLFASDNEKKSPVLLAVPFTLSPLVIQHRITGDFFYNILLFNNLDGIVLKENWRKNTL